MRDVVLLRNQVIENFTRTFITLSVLVQEYINSLENNGELLDKLAVDSTYNSGDLTVETSRSVLYMEHLPLAKLQLGLKCEKYLQVC